MPGNEDQPAKGDIEPAVSEPEAEPDTAEVEVLPPELAQQIPPAVRKKVSAFFMHASSMVDPLAAKVTSEHISKSIDLAQDNANKNFDYAKGGRWYQFVVFLIAVAVAIFLIVYLVEKEKPE